MIVMKKRQELSQQFKALGHPTRLFIVSMLSQEREKCVCELNREIDADVSTVSKHLQVLKTAGIINSYKKGNMVIYYLEDIILNQYLKEILV